MYEVFHIFLHKLTKWTIISTNTHIMVRATYDEFKSSTKIISQENLTSDGAFSSSTQNSNKADLQNSVLHNSQHTKHHKLQ